MPKRRDVFSLGGAALVLIAGAVLFCEAGRAGFGSGSAEIRSGSKKALASASTAPARVFRASPSATRLARGRYLVESVMSCFGCHSEINADVQPLPGMKGAGAVFPGKRPFRVVALNITPDKETGIGNWTDAQLANAIRDGIAPDGRQLFPVMPYMNYRALSDEDLKAIIVYLRSIPPVRHALARSGIPSAVLASLPKLPPVREPAPPPNLSSPVRRGKYLVTLADCHTCHTPMDPQGRFLPGMDFAGGRILDGPWGRVASANITPDPSGISYYTRAMFFQVMREGRLGARELNPIMLSGYFRGMSDRDIGAIFAYLKTLKPVKHRVDNTDPPTRCRLDGQMHGLGDLN
jgi:mono/diheme cytochrome c family protein